MTVYLKGDTRTIKGLSESGNEVEHKFVRDTSYLTKLRETEDQILIDLDGGCTIWVNKEDFIPDYEYVQDMVVINFRGVRGRIDMIDVKDKITRQQQIELQNSLQQVLYSWSRPILMSKEELLNESMNNVKSFIAENIQAVLFDVNDYVTIESGLNDDNDVCYFINLYIACVNETYKINSFVIDFGESSEFVEPAICNHELYDKYTEVLFSIVNECDALVDLLDDKMDIVNHGNFTINVHKHSIDYSLVS